MLLSKALLMAESLFCKMEEKNGIAQIKRYNRKRAIKISADTENHMLPKELSLKIEEIFKEKYEAQFPGVTLDMEGEFAEFNKVFEDLFGLGRSGIHQQCRFTHYAARHENDQKDFG